jgi:DNA-binding PadR family transcriptional regulator
MPMPGGLRAQRGDVRSAILGLLAEEPMHGYQMISELERRSDGRWRPSAGSVYPTLQQLEDEGLVRASERDGRRVFELTEAGRAAADTASRGGSGSPWASGGGSDAVQLRDLLHQVMAATLQLAQVGSPATTGEARKLLVETRRGLYRLLAEDDGGSADAAPADAAPADAAPTDAPPAA